MMFTHYEQIINAVKAGFQQKPVLVVGDLLLDIYYWGEVQRISPEAPVPVVQVKSESWNAGGAANVAMNLAGLGLSVRIAGLVGADGEKTRLLQLLNTKGIDTGAVITATGWRTITKTRVIASNQMMLRLDKEEPVECTAQESADLIQAVQQEIENGPAAIVLSDYGKGVLTAPFCRQIITLARKRGIPVLVDPKGRDFAKYSGASLISPNRSEMAKVTNLSPADLDGMLQSGQQLCRKLAIGTFLITLGEQGIACIQAKSLHHFPATAKEVYDVSGAGDTVIAIMAAGLAGDADLHDTIHLANIAAGIVVSKIGIYPITTNDLLRAIAHGQGSEEEEKICQLAELVGRVERWRDRGERVVFTNGCFDLLHAGHVACLEQARRLGERLIVGLNSDRSVRELKGPARPLICQEDRARVLAALAAVDAVVIFDDKTPLALIRTIRPDILAKGADYSADQVVGADFVKAHGGRTVLVPLVEGRSSSAIINAVHSNTGHRQEG
jgi:D-beta-D-heptose 7-phosphate kinase / D-beta-D-heptose 1-phosphate adenosyltransferase